MTIKLSNLVSSALAGETGATGATGYTGATGATGYTGATGAQGVFGGQAADIYYTKTDTSATDPGSGYFKFDSTTFSSITKLYISKYDHNSYDLFPILNQIDASTSSIKGNFSIADELTPDTRAMFSITGALVSHTTWYEFPCLWLSGETSFDNGTDIIITFQKTGDKGDTGLTGATGVQGIPAW